MDEQELRRQAAHFKRVASLVLSEALLEPAAAYEAMAYRLRDAPTEGHMR
jgi:hypothetical protein